MRSESSGSQRATEDPAGQQREILKLIAPSVRWMAAQRRSGLRQALGREGSHTMARLVAQSRDVEVMVAKRLEARLPELIRDEVQRAFEDLLNGGETEEIEGRAPRGAIGELAESVGAEKQFRALRSGGGTELGPMDDSRIPRLDRSDSPPYEESPQLKEVSAVTEHRGSEENGAPLLARADEEPYEGTVLLMLEASRGIGQVLQFVRELCQGPEIRLVKLASNRANGVDVWLALRQPVQLLKILPELEGVAGVSAQLQPGRPGYQRTLTVQLSGGPSRPPGV